MIAVYNIIAIIIMERQRERSERGISMQQIRPQLQMALIEPVPPEPDLPDRLIEFTDGVLSKYTHTGKPVPNTIRNQKYSILTFVPLVLFKQFQYFFNLFYLLTALSQFIPILKVGLLFSFVAPLVLVLLLTMIKQGYEDYHRYKKDKQINSALFNKIVNNTTVAIKAEEIQVGDLLQVTVGDNIPADCMVLASLNEKSSIFIKTDQLDGQTDWKLRKPPTHGPYPPKFTLQLNAPVCGIYDFAATMEIEGSEQMGVGIEQTMWRGVKMAAGRVVLLVIYTGKQTKLSLNSKESGNKFGLLDQQLNTLSKILFIIMLLLSLALVLLRGSYGSVGESFLLLFKYFLLLSSIIPISMRVNLDFAKLLYKYQIDNDKEMPGCQCRNSNIPEELGRIRYVLTDKTGTLTQNEMIFKRLLLGEGLLFESEEKQQMEKILQEQAVGHEEEVRKLKVTRAVLALSICHNVTPVIDNDVRGLQGSSPDELTLVSFAESLGYVLIERTEEEIVMDTPAGRETYYILDIFPFTSESKSMGIIVESNSSITYYLKGADAVMGPKIGQTDANFMEQSCLDLAREGLRTLVIAQKTLSVQRYQKWKKDLKAASASLKNRDQRIKECRNQIEKGMDFVAVTGVEDKLQAGVMQTVGSLRSIGVKVWMLTGDKIQTAICVGRAVRLIQGRDERLFIIQDTKSRGEFHQKLDGFYREFNIDRRQLGEHINCVMVIDGASLKWALEQTAKQFFDLAVRLPAIICSRVSPTQKAQIALLVREFGQGRVLGIGDGGNDVALIQSAHVGVGIYGKEGIQAALASDFSVSQFSDLNPLLYWHGRLAYKRSSLLSQFIIHRGTIITIMQTIFCIEYYFIPLPIYNGFLLLGYSTVFTMLPVFSLVLDEDISRRVALDYPILYKRTQAGNELNFATFMYWMFISVYQGSIIMILIEVLLGQESFFMVSTISFTCLIIIQFLNIFTELHRIKLAQVISALLSLLIYFLLLFLLKNVLNGIELFSTAYLPSTVLIVAAAWAPPFVYQIAKRIIDPTEEQKLMRDSDIGMPLAPVSADVSVPAPQPSGQRVESAPAPALAPAPQTIQESILI